MDHICECCLLCVLGRAKGGVFRGRVRSCDVGVLGRYIHGLPLPPTMTDVGGNAAPQEKSYISVEHASLPDIRPQGGGRMLEVSVSRLGARRPVYVRTGE